MTANNLFDAYHVRKWYAQTEDTLTNENGLSDDGRLLRKVVIAAAIRNPYAGRYSESLDLIVGPSPQLGEWFAQRLLAQFAGVPVESYGKACVVGVAGEYEHGNAFLTSIFADPIRRAIGGGESWIPSTGKRGGPGATIDVPLAHKDALYVRSHYDTITATFSDGPNPDEVLVIVAAASRGRIRARLGGPAAPGTGA